MNIREREEQWEKEYLSPYAALSINSRGRDREEEPCDMRTVYQRDRDRILHCKAFRRMKHKTQVFLAPEGDHYRTRLTHTLEVAQIARTIARCLRLNEPLTEAIALGHDIGHTPFGHAGERILNQLTPGGFAHYRQSVRIVEVLEKNGEGLNLTWEVRNGIMNHRTTGHPATLEGDVVRLSDKVAYINHDIDDAIRGKIFREEDIPRRFTDVLGNSVKNRLDLLIRDIIRQSEDRDHICMSPEVEEAMHELRKWMFENVYTNPRAKSEEGKAQNMLTMLWDYYLEHTEEMPAEYIELMQTRNEPKTRVVCDYIAGMTDIYAINKFTELFVPVTWKG